MPKPGKHLACSLEGPNWFVQAHFIVEGTNVVAVELSAKSATYARPLIKVRVNGELTNTQLAHLKVLVAC